MTVLTDTQVVTASGGLVELGYSQITSAVTVTASSTDASPVTVIPALTVVCDGSPVLVEFFAPFWANNAAGGYLNIGITQDGTLKNRWATNYAGANTAAGQTLQLRTTPTAGVHTFAVTANVNGNPAAGSINAGTYGAGSGTSPPAFLRVSKIVQATQWPAVTTGTIICTSSTRPASPFVGQQIYETDTSKSLIYNGTAWVSPQAQTVPPMVRIARTSGQSFSNTVWDFVTGWTEIFDTDNMWTSANNYIEIQTAGVYLVQYGGAYAINGTADRLVGISRNDAVAGNSSIHTANQDAIAVSDTSMQGSFLFNLAALDKLRFQSYQNSGGALLLGTAGNGYAYISALLVGKPA